MKRPFIEVPIDSETDKQRIETQLRQLASHAGWKILKSQLTLWRDFSQENVNRIGADQTPKYGDAEIYRRELMFLDMLIDFPENMVQHIMQKDDSDIEDFDPYQDNLNLGS